MKLLLESDTVDPVSLRWSQMADYIGIQITVNTKMTDYLGIRITTVDSVHLGVILPQSVQIQCILEGFYHNQCEFNAFGSDFTTTSVD